MRTAGQQQLRHIHPKLLLMETFSAGNKLGILSGLLLAGFLFSCGGGSSEKTVDLCACVPSASDSLDHRHAGKHVPLPNGTPQEISVSTILSWPVDRSLLAANAPRAGREIQLFHIGHAFLQRVKLEGFDCDVHFEISGDASKTAPRVIVELPVDSEYCEWRRLIQKQLAAKGISISTTPQELSSPIPVDVRGLAFEDDPHATRGTKFVATIWEIHPAIVQLQ